MNSFNTFPRAMFTRAVIIALLLAGTLLAALPGSGAAAAAPSPVAAPAATGQTCTVFQPNGTNGTDSYIKQEKPDERRGGDSELRVKSESTKLMRSLLKFDITGLPAGTVISSATLSLWQKDGTGGAITVNAHKVTASWKETEVTWKARDKAAKLNWTTPGGDYNAAIAASATVDDTKNVWRTWNLTSLAADWVSNPSGNYGVILEASGKKAEKKFKSGDDGTATQRPKLEVCYNAGVTIEPDNSGDGVAGLTRTYAHVVRVGSLTTAVNLTASSSLGWATRIYKDVNGNGVKDPEDTLIAATPSIGPNAEYPILVQVDVPLSATPGVTDVTTVTATGQSGGATDTATDRTQVGKQLSVQPDLSNYATAGSVLFYGHQIINNGDVQDCITVSAASSQGWQVLLWQDLNANGVHETSNPNEPPLDSAVCINPGGHFHFVAEVRVPAGAATGTIDHTVLTGTSGNDPSRSDTAVDTTQVFANTPPVVDGKYDDIYKISPDADEVCYTSNGTLFGKLASFYQATSDSVYFVLAIDKDFVDNTYGTNAIGWPSGHTFDNLLGSDHAQFQGYDANDTLVLDFKLDYIATQTGTSSGYKSCGVYSGTPYCTGKSDGKMNLGSASSILAWGTSFEYSLNYPGYCSGGNCAIKGTDLEVNSPATDAFYKVNPTYPDWIFDVIYEVKVAKSAFGAAGFGSMDVPYIHASPSKVGTNTIYAEPGVCPGEIGDRVWNDTNGNGLQDAGEPGINGVQVKLYKDNGDGVFNAATDLLAGTLTTASNGNYLFQNLEPNDYFVDVVDSTVPAGYKTTTYNDPTPVINLGEGQSYLDADFGYTIGAAIGDFVWEDLDKDGIQDAGEPGMVGVTVNLYDGAGNKLATTTTDGNGFYSFPNRPAGSYQVEFVPPYSYVFSPALQGTDRAKDSDAVPSTGRTAVFTMTAGVPDLTRDAGLYYQAPSACDVSSSIVSSFNGTAIAAGRTLWFNTNFKVAGLDPTKTTTLYFDQSNITFSAGSTNYNLAVPRGKIVFSPSATTTTTTFDAATNTWVTTVSPGNFSNNVWLSGLAWTVPAGGLPGGINPVTWNGRFSTDQPNVTVSWQWSAAVYTTFGADYNALGVKPVDGSTQNPYPNADLVGTPENYKTYVTGGARGGGGSNYTGSWSATGNATPCPTAIIGDRVWRDANSNGIQDTGETGIPGVTVRLYENCTSLIAATTTDASGLYRFSVPAGNYCVQFTPPAGYVFSPVRQGTDPAVDSDADPTTGRTPITNLYAGETDLTWDAGLTQNASVGDRVWEDTDADGIQDPGEPGVPDVQVDLFDGTGSWVASDWTDANGIYGFTDLPPGDYYLNFNAPGGHVFSPQNQGADPARDSDPSASGTTAPFTLVAGQNDPTRDAGVYPVAALGDLVWEDTDGDGIQDPNELGVANVTVNLYDGTGALIDLTTTDDVGIYMFSGLVPDTYCVEFVKPSGMTFTRQFQGTDPDLDSNADPATGKAPCVTLAPGDENMTIDAGVVPSGAIGDFVWYDTNRNGIEDVGEPGIANVTIDLYRSGVKVATTTTDADGGYLFPNLPPGNYTVDVTDVYGKLTGLQHIVANQSMPDPMAVTLGLGEINKDIDFGYVRVPVSGKAIIGDTVWYDANGDGIQQPSEPGIPGVQVCATPAAGGTATCATTDSNGHYLIEVLAGTYNVQPTNPPSGYSATTPVPHKATVAAGEQYLDADFGYRSLTLLGRIGNLVFHDANTPQGNGVFDAGDSAISGVSVDLIRDTNGNKVWDAGEPIIATVTTGSVLDMNNGNYLFTGVPTGNYLVHVSDVAAVLTDYTRSMLGIPAADNNNQADPYPVSLPSGGSNLTADFGYEISGPPGHGDPDGVIGNQVWIETDGNGLFNPDGSDVGQPGVSVELYKDGQPYATTTTGASGRYAFVHLPGGNYAVFVSDVAGVLVQYQVTKLGPNPGQDNNNQAQPYAIGLPEHSYNPTADFGYTLPAAIGDYVWYDTDADGIQDVLEHGIGNVTVDLYRDTGDGAYNPATDKLVAIRTTGADGGYLFTGLEPGVYFVDVTDRNAALGGLTHTLGPQSQPDPTGAIPLAAGQNYRDADFGYVRVPVTGKAIIGDTVWYDGNGNGVAEPGEPGISGVQVCATPAAGGSPICDTTDQNGLYQIEVPAGTYTVAPTNPPAGYTATTPVPAGPITVNGGDQYLDADFGYDSPNLGKIGGTVWDDKTPDGLLATGEPRLPGVSVDLVKDLNNNGTVEPGEPVVATDVTDTNGDYLFDGVPAGNYLVIVSDTHHVLDDFTPTVPGPNPGQDNNNQEQPYAVSLSPGETDTTADFGYVSSGVPGKKGAIGNQVWYEADGDGLYDPDHGDTGIAGVTVALYRDGTLAESTTTGSSGVYVFTSLPAGNYSVRVTDDAGVLTSYIGTVLGPNPGQDDNNQAQPYAIVLPSEGINMTADFGYTRPGAIGDYVWYDANRDGVENVDEPGIPNVTLDLYRGSVKVATTTTDADGGYLFANLPPGTYVVDVTDANGKLTGLTHIIANQSQPDPTAAITLDAGQAYKDADFGYVKTPNTGKAIIGDTVWYDANGDGLQQPGEPGVPGVQVCATPGGGGTAVCATTDGNGLYRVEVPAGTYTVQPTNPPSGYTATTPASVTVTVAAGDQYLDADFGYDSNTLLGRIGNLVFLDADRSRVFDGLDSPFVGVSVDLIRDTNGNKAWDAGEPIIATVTTGNALDINNGNYLFPGVPGGTYLVHVSDTNAVLTDYARSPLGTAGADNHNQADPYAVSLPSGASNLTADFGYYQTTRPNVGVIGNQVWIETAANGLFDTATGDIGQAGVGVELYKDGQWYGLTFTGASGDYSFIGLPAGTYTTTVRDDFGVLTGYAVTALGPNPGQDNNNQQQPYQVVLPTAGYNLTADFGYTLPQSSIGDTVFYDDNRNGSQDGLEKGIPGIVVELYRDGTAACDTRIGTQTTNASGKYLFVNLPAGHYCVKVPETGDVNPFLVGFDRTAGTNPHSVTLAAGQNYLDADFGYAGYGDIRGVVYYDWNRNGVKGLGEDGISGARVCLYADANNDGVKDSPTPIGVCPTTDSFGNYAFTHQLPGHYLLEQTLPSGLTNTTPLVIGANLIVTQGSGLSADNNFGDVMFVRLGDFVWIDVNGDGVQQPTETAGLTGVPLQVSGTDITGHSVNQTITSSGGNYLVSGLIPGTYIVSAPLTFNGYALTSPSPRSTTLSISKTEDLTLDFGYAYPTGLQVQQFGAFSENGQVTLSWAIQGFAPDGFNVWRADNAKGIDAVQVTAQPVQAANGIDYEYIDTDVTAGQTYWYWLENPADGQRYGPTGVTVRAEPAVRLRTYLPAITR